MVIRNILVLGAGSAGLIAALTIKRRLPQLDVRIVRSPDIKVIGVGEGTTPNFPRHMFEYLGISRKFFYSKARPTWKCGIRFYWGERPQFFYGFGQQLDARWADLPLPHGFYCDEEFRFTDQLTSLMECDKVFLRQPDSDAPIVHDFHAFHMENVKLVETLEQVARESGIEFIEARVEGTERGPEGIEALVLEDGRKLEADYFVDASGFRSELLGKALEEPFVSYDQSLFCDRAIIGGWDRTSEPILPYTTAETMDAGWCWQIEHEHFLNRGYVYSSSFISDEDAKTEFLRKNPQAPESARLVKFRSGRYRNGWVDNVLAFGNACGFVEPLEATALMLVCWQCMTWADMLVQTHASPTPTMKNLYNEVSNTAWDEVRDFLAIHYRFNGRLGTPFWKHCRAETDLGGAEELLKFYQENGPASLCQYLLRDYASQFGIEGFLVMLVGNKVPYQNHHQPLPESQLQIWRQHCENNRLKAQTGMDMKEALAFVHHPQWQWRSDR